MIGTEPGAFFPKEDAQIGPSILSVRGLSGAGFVEDVSFEVRAGEILGFFGLVGAGRTPGANCSSKGSAVIPTSSDSRAIRLRYMA